MEGVDWGPAVAFLLGGVVIGALILWRFVFRESLPRASGVDARALERRDLEAKLEARVAQLQDIDLSADARGVLASERRRLEVDAARALGALEQVLQDAAKLPRQEPPAKLVGSGIEASASEPARAAPASSLRGFLWGVGSAAAIGLVLLFASRSARERAPGGSATGNLPAEDTRQATSDAEAAALEERLRENPEDDETRLDLARLHLTRQDMMGVFNETQTVLQKNPRNGRALAYQALVRLAMGQADRAEAMLKLAIELEPDLLDGYIHLMLVYTRLGRGQDADGVRASAVRRFPEQADRLESLQAQLRAAGAEEPTTAAVEDAHAGVAPPGGPAQAAGSAAPAAAGGRASRRVAGTLELDASARAGFVPGSVVFVTLREAGFGAGPPIAARRLVANGFPLAFEIGEGDSMSGQPVPDSVLVEARLDSDGDPVTRPRADPYGNLDQVAIGRSGLRILLKPRE